MIYRMKGFFLFFAISGMLVIGCATGEVAKNDDPLKLEPPERESSVPAIPHEIYKARDSVLDFFTPLNGMVEVVEEGTAGFRVSEDVLVKKDMRISVYRESDPFYHPVTNELIGKSDELVGTIVVTGDRTDDGLYLSQIIDGAIRAGDHVRITSSRIKIAFFQDRKADWTVSEAFYNALKDSGRFEILDSHTADYDAGTLAGLGAELGADAVLMFSTPVREDKKVINIKMYWPGDAVIFGEIEEETGQDISGAFAAEEEFISRTIVSAKPWRSFKLPDGRLMAMGDVDGNGADELVISNGRDIRIYRMKEELQELWFIKGRGDGVHLSLDILDTNSNGMAEIFVTAIVNAGTINTGDSEIYSDDIKMESFVIEYDTTEGYRRIEDNIRYFLRVSGNVLLMQRFNKNSIYGGSVLKGEWKEGRYKPQGQLKLPAGVNIYGFTFVDWKNEGRSDLLTFDDQGYLYLYDENGDLMWRSEESYGPFVYTFDKRSQSAVQRNQKWFIRGRLMIVNTERGQEVVALNRKPVMPGLPGLGSGEADVYSLWWDSSSMEEKIILHEIPGAVTDYWIEGSKLFLIDRGNLLSLFSGLKEGSLSGGSILHYYNFGDK